MATRAWAQLVGVSLALAAGACSDSAAPRSSPPKASTPSEVAAPRATFRPPADVPLGVGELDELAWSSRAGQAAFRRARAAERRGQWQEMVAQCQAALAADATHLEASWLLAAGLSRLGRFAEVGAPLARAISGDPGKWGPPALSLPLFSPYWQSGHGEALRPWIEDTLRALTSALARSLVLVHAQRLVAYDRASQRYLPLARPHRVRGALVSPPFVAFATRSRVGADPVERLGVVDLRTAAVTLTPLPAARRRELALWSSSDETVPVVRSDGGTWLEARGASLVAPSAPIPRELAPRLSWRGERAVVARGPLAEVMADWDHAQMASAMRLRRSNRVIAAPAPSMIDGHRVVFSPSKERLAYVTGVDECEGAPVPTAASFRAYVVEVAAGAPREVARADDGLDLAWVDDKVLAVGGPTGVALYELAYGQAPSEPVVLPDVALPRAVPRARCVDAEAPSPDPDPDEL